MKISILDEGKFSRPENWNEQTLNDGDDIKLYIDNNYIGAGTVTADGIIFISTLHKVELRKDA